MEYRTSLGDAEWMALVDHYGQTGMCLGLGRGGEGDKIRRAFERSFRYVCAWDDGKVVGAGRMISDGECYGWIHDLSVLAEWRGQGIGKALMERLLMGNGGLLVGLTSSFEAVDFYVRLGFHRHRTAMAKYPGYSDYLIYEGGNEE